MTDLETKKQNVLNQAETFKLQNLKRMITYIYKVVDYEEDLLKFLDFFWNEINPLSSMDLLQSMNKITAKFFSSIDNCGKYLVNMIWKNGLTDEYGKNAIAVREFTEGARGKQPDTPLQPLSRDKAEFIVSMVCSEMVELLQTVLEPDEDPISVIRNLCNKDYNSNYIKPEPTDHIRLIAEQADAMVDAMYYMYDTATRMGVNLDRVFNIVQNANMAKGLNGKFIIRPSDNKIIKPDGWKEPDIYGEIERQMNEGSWM